MNPFSINECCSDEDAQIWGDVLAQAVTGELIGAMNYETLAELYHDADEKAEAREHAAGERAHAAMFRAAGREIGIEVAVNLDAQYWKRIRSAFLARAEAGDLVDCIVAQEVMLESFAVASYQVVAAAAPGKLGCHLRPDRRRRSRTRRSRDRNTAGRARARSGRLRRSSSSHARAGDDGSRGDGRARRPERPLRPLQGQLRQASLPRVGLGLSEVRGASLRRYLKTLDEIGVPGESSLAWLAQLPV